MADLVTQEEFFVDECPNCGLMGRILSIRDRVTCEILRRLCTECWRYEKGVDR